MIITFAVNVPLTILLTILSHLLIKCGFIESRGTGSNFLSKYFIVHILFISNRAYYSFTSLYVFWGARLFDSEQY